MKSLARAAQHLGGAVFLALFGVFIVQITARFLFSKPLPWTDELAVVLYLWAILWACAFMVPEREHVVFDLLWNHAGRRTRQAMRVLGHSMIGGLALLALPARWDYVHFMRREGSPVFVHGFVEGNDIGAGVADVVVTDGFTGNVALKAIEGTAKLYTQFVRDAFRTSTFAKLGYLFASGAWSKLRVRVDPRRYNGGVFLGLDGVCVKSHGGSDALGFAYAIGVAVDLVRYEYKSKLVEGLARLHEITSATETPSASLQTTGGTA